MGNDSSSQEEVLLAIALGSGSEGTERRMVPDRRSGVERRKARQEAPYERRSGAERRQSVRRKVDRREGVTLLQKARSRLSGRSRQQRGGAGS
jgi:hypothetical protein